jgi:hypothetical protein
MSSLSILNLPEDLLIKIVDWARKEYQLVQGVPSWLRCRCESDVPDTVHGNCKII